MKYSLLCKNAVSLAIRGLSASTFAAISFLLITSGSAAAEEFQFRCEGIEEKAELSSFHTKIYQGAAGWFFRKSDLESMYEQPEYVIETLVNINKALEYKGIHLILLPMLPRGISGRDYIPNQGMLSDMIYDAKLSSDQFNAMVNSLRAHGLDVVNTNEILDEAVGFSREKFAFKRDVHWRPEGAELVADTVAKHVLSFPGEARGSIAYETTSLGEGRIVKSGFNIALNELCNEAIPPETLVYYKTTQVIDGLDELIGESPDRKDYLHVVGSSFTDEQNPFHFNDFLRRRLGNTVSGFSVSGGGVNQSLYSWSHNTNGIGRLPNFIVWEIPNNFELQSFGGVMNATIVPAIFGDCIGDDLKYMGRINGARVNLDLPAGKKIGSGGYIKVSTEGADLDSINVTYEYRDGSEQAFKIEKPPRVSGFGVFYHSPPYTSKGIPVGIGVNTKDGRELSGSIKVCSYPAGAIQASSANN